MTATNACPGASLDWPGTQDARVQALLAISFDAVLVLRHADRRIVAASASAQRLYGRSEAALCALHYDDLVTDRSAVAEIFERHREHVPLRYHRRADGSRFPVELALHWLEEAGSELCCMRVRDLAQAEEEGRRLRAAQASYRAIFQAAPFPILLLDRRGAISDANDAALALYRHTLATLIGQPVARLLQDERAARHYFRHPQWQASGERHVRADGASFLADVFVSTVRLSEEAHAVVVVHDVTEQRLLLERLQASEARWRFALEGHGDALWEWDLARSSFHVSRELSEQIGRAPRPQEQAASYWSELVHPGDRERLSQAMLAHLKGHSQLVDVEVRIHTLERGERWVWLRGRVMERSSTGRALRMLGSMRDVHAQKQQAQELAHWREQVQHSARVTSMGEMAAALAHELNQPLASIRTFSAAALHRLEKPALRNPTELRRTVQLIADESLRAGRIVQHIREFVRKGPAQTQALSLNAIVTDVQRLADIQAQRLGAHIQLNLAPDLPTVCVNRVQAEQLLLNLVSNGLEAMRDTTGARQVDISTMQAETGMVRLSVRDQGQGLPPELAQKIYTPFFTTKAEGLGMGLAICHSIVEAHHGRIWAEAAAGGGTVFHVTLPLALPTTLAETPL